MLGFRALRTAQAALAAARAAGREERNDPDFSLADGPRPAKCHPLDADRNAHRNAGRNADRD
jgi:hypothetical protein